MYYVPKRINSKHEGHLSVVYPLHCDFLQTMDYELCSLTFFGFRMTMMSIVTLLVGFASLAAAASISISVSWNLIRIAKETLADYSLAALPSPTAKSSSYAFSVDGPGLSSVSYSYAYTVTTPTTAWTAPIFATPASLPPCNGQVCPSSNGKRCLNVDGVQYGILCNTF